MKTIMAAVDLSDHSEMVARCALSLAGPEDKLYLVHVAQPNPDFIGYEMGPDTVRDVMAHSLQAEHRALHQLKEGLADGEDPRLTALLIQGPTVDKILEERERLEADLLVLGSHGHGALYHLLTGSVTEGVLKKAACPVLVVPVSEKE